MRRRVRVRFLELTRWGSFSGRLNQSVNKKTYNFRITSLTPFKTSAGMWRRVFSDLKEEDLNPQV